MSVALLRANAANDSFILLREEVTLCLKAVSQHGLSKLWKELTLGPSSSSDFSAISEPESEPDLMGPDSFDETRTWIGSVKPSIVIIPLKPGSSFSDSGTSRGFGSSINNRSSRDCDRLCPLVSGRRRSVLRIGEEDADEIEMGEAGPPAIAGFLLLFFFFLGNSGSGTITGTGVSCRDGAFEADLYFLGRGRIWKGRISG